MKVLFLESASPHREHFQSIIQAKGHLYRCHLNSPRTVSFIDLRDHAADIGFPFETATGLLSDRDQYRETTGVIQDVRRLPAFARILDGEAAILFVISPMAPWPASAELSGRASRS